MKLKRLPEDFQVEELSDFPPLGGDYALYVLTKRSMGTPEVVEALCRRWRIPQERVGWGGLKDRYSLTRQFVTIRHGPRRNLRQKSFELAYLGQAPRPYKRSDIAANRFEIVLRDLPDRSAAAAESALADAARDGLPNYFDDQRFGSLGESGEFTAAAWCAGDFERALWLAIADPNMHDRPKERRRKQLLREHWGRWAEVIPALEGSPRMSALRHLTVNSTDFRGAFARIPGLLRGLYLSAYQGHLWNRVLGELLRRTCRPEQLLQVRLRTGEVPFPRTLDTAQRQSLSAAIVPFPSARARIEGPMKELVESVLAGMNLRMDALRIRYPSENFFLRGQRAAMFTPGTVSHELEPDDLYPGKHKLRLRFELPRGCYATILVKRLTA